MEIDTICKELGITIKEFYSCMNTNQQKLSYQKNKNKVKYQDMITAGIINFYKLDHQELLTILRLYKLQNK